MEKGQKDDAIYALAEALTGNFEGLKDPTVQTNALLSKILLILTSMFQQSNSSGGMLMDTLMGMALGGTPSMVTTNLGV